MNSKTLGWIGLGSFGGFAVAALRHHFEVRAWDAADRADEADALGIELAGLSEVAASPYLGIAVPIQAFPEVLERVAPHVRPGSLVFDVGSVKSGPVAGMLATLPAAVEVVGTHPLFGPQSAARGLEGRTIVVCPARTGRLDQIETFLTRRLGLKVVVTDPETHDREIATTQALAQFLGRALAGLDGSDSPIRTPAYDWLQDVARTVADDSWELFAAIQNLNPWAGEVRRELLERLRRLDERLAADATASGGPGENIERGENVERGENGEPRASEGGSGSPRS